MALPDAELDRLRAEFAEHLSAAEGETASRPAGTLSRARVGIIESERTALLALRRGRQIGDDVLQKLVRELDLAELALMRGTE